jgi:hypothetical protein
MKTNGNLESQVIQIFCSRVGWVGTEAKLHEIWGLEGGENLYCGLGQMKLWSLVRNFGS